MKARHITQAMMDALAEAAAAAPRRRKNLNFHSRDDDACHRLLNAVEPDSYIRAHRHLDPAKDETIVAVRGRFGVLIFDDAGSVTESRIIGVGGDAVGSTIPHGVFHTFMALEPGSIFFETKAGPYVPLTAEEIAPWAPAEGTAEAVATWSELRRVHFAD